MSGVRRGVLWAVAGQGVAALCRWGALVLIAKLCAPEELGRYTLGLALATPAMLLANLATRPVLVTRRSPGFFLGDYVGLRLWTAPAAWVVVVGTALAAEYSAEACLVVGLVGAAKAVESVGDVLQGVLQRFEAIGAMAAAEAGREVVVVGGLALGVGLAGSLWLGLALGAASSLAWLVLFELPRARRRMPGEPLCGAPSRYPALCWLALPLGVSTALLSLGAQVPRFFVEHHLGEAALGIFGALTFLFIPPMMLVTALGRTASPRLASLRAARDRTGYARVLESFLTLALGLGLLGVAVASAAGAPLLRLFYTGAYAAHAPVLVWLAVAFAIAALAGVLGYSLTALEAYRPQPWIFGASTAVTAIACLVLVPGQAPALPLCGAAQAACVGALAQLVFSLAAHAHAWAKPLIPEVSPWKAEPLTSPEA